MRISSARSALSALLLFSLAFAGSAAAEDVTLIAAEEGSRDVTVPSGANADPQADSGIESGEVTFLSVFGTPVAAPIPRAERDPSASLNPSSESEVVSAPAPVVTLYAPAAVSSTRGPDGTLALAVAADAGLDGFGNDAALLAVEMSGSGDRPVDVTSCTSANLRPVCAATIPGSGDARAAADPIISRVPEASAGGYVSLMP